MSIIVALAGPSLLSILALQGARGSEEASRGTSPRRVSSRKTEGKSNGTCEQIYGGWLGHADLQLLRGACLRTAV